MDHNEAEYAALIKRLERLWEKGAVCRGLVGAYETPFAAHVLKLPVKKGEAAQCFAVLREWADFWRVRARRGGACCCLEEREVLFRSIGAQRLPCRIVVNDPEGAAELLGKAKEGKVFQRLFGQIVGALPQLEEWCLRYPQKVLRNRQVWPQILAVAQYFLAHSRRERKGLYLRQLGLPGVDTKFIGKHKKIVQEVLLMLLPADQRVDSGVDFYERFDLKKPPKQILARFLDDAYALQGVTDFAASAVQLARMERTPPRVFITENQINGRAFPRQRDSMILFGEGFGILEAVETIPWLRDKEVYYWGDIDTYGFDILSRIRAVLPQIRSFLMNEGTLRKHLALCVEEKRTSPAAAPHLTEAEAAVLRLLRGNTLGKNLRLEQEKIPYEEIVECLAKPDATPSV